MDKLNFKCYESPFATRLRALMKKNNTRQNTLAELLGVTRQSISQYCDGTSVPPIDKIVILSKYYNVSTDYILGVSENDAPNDDEALKIVCEYIGLNNNAVKRLSEASQKPFTKIFLEYFIEEKKLLNLLARYFVSTSVQYFIKNSDYSLIPIKKNDNETRIIFADIIEHLPIARKNFDEDLNNNPNLLDKLCLDYLLWAVDKDECKRYNKEFLGLDSYCEELTEEEQRELDRVMREEFENKSPKEHELEELQELENIKKFMQSEEKRYNRSVNAYLMIEKLFKYEKQKEGVKNGNNPKEGQQL